MNQHPHNIQSKLNNEIINNSVGPMDSTNPNSSLKITIKKIGIITSGGDCGGLNAVIKAAASTALAYGIEPVVIPNGYAGLYNLEDISEDKLVVLTRERLSNFSSVAAGSEAGHSRVKISKINNPEKYERIKRGLLKHKIDAIIVSGGDDTGSVVVDLTAHGFLVNHAPKTMDMDLQPYSVGADSTFNNIARAIDSLKTTGRSHNRIFILEVFGRYVGHSALRGGVAADADCIIIPEIIPDYDIIYEHLLTTFSKRILSSDVSAGTYSIVTAEALRGDPTKDTVDEHGFLIDKNIEPDAFGHYPLAGASKKIERELKTRMKNDPRMKEFMKHAGIYVFGQYEIPEIRIVKPTHLMRSGFSSALDVNFGREVGAGAVLLMIQGISGMTVCSVRNGCIEYMPTKLAIKQRGVDLNQVTLFEKQGICFGRKPVLYDCPPLKEIDFARRVY